MRHLIICLIAITAGCLGMKAQNYSIHSVTPGVKLQSSGNTSDAQAGMKLKASDSFIIPDEGVVEVYNPLDKRVYRSLRPGSISVTKLIIEARNVASDNSRSVDAKLRFSKSNSANTNKRIYVEKGMVTRSQAVYDPEAENLEMNPATLGGYIAARLLDKAAVDTVMPVKYTHGPAGDNGLRFEVENSLDFPVYFNIVKFNGADKKVEISPLGQPGAPYVMLPRQSMSRVNPTPLDQAARHFIVMTPCLFDLDEVLEEVAKAIEHTPEAKADDTLPVFVAPL